MIKFTMKNGLEAFYEEKEGYIQVHTFEHLIDWPLTFENVIPPKFKVHKYAPVKYQSMKTPLGNALTINIPVEMENVL